MANIRNYFRHSFNAHNNIKIRQIIDDMGMEGYGYYFSLIEIYGNAFLDKNEDGFVEIHQSIFRGVWRKSNKSCEKVITKFQQSSIILCTKVHDSYRLSIPNFLKYYGPYEKLKGKRKEKEKEKKRKEKDTLEKECVSESPLRINQVMIDWNEIFNGLDSPIKKINKITDEYEFLINSAMKEFPCLREIGSWKTYFEKIIDIEFLNGGGSSNWICDFEWCVTTKNIQKVISGKYDTHSNVSHIKKMMETNPFRSVE